MYTWQGNGIKFLCQNALYWLVNIFFFCILLCISLCLLYGHFHKLIDVSTEANCWFSFFMQCSNGHTLCSGCKPRVHNRCPTCRRELGNIRCCIGEGWMLYNGMYKPYVDFFELYTIVNAALYLFFSYYEKN